MHKERTELLRIRLEQIRVEMVGKFKNRSGFLVKGARVQEAAASPVTWGKNLVRYHMVK